jgi:signal transduction histidine kinase
MALVIASPACNSICGKTDRLLPDAVIDVSTLQWAYLGLLSAFTICMALMLQFAPSSGLRWWLASNVSTAASFALFAGRGTFSTRDLAYLLPTLLVVLAAALKVVAVSSGALRNRLAPPLAIGVVIFAALYKVLDRASLASPRLALSMFALAILTALIARTAWRNPRWRELRGRGLLVCSFCFSSIVLTINGAAALSGLGAFEYFSQGGHQSVNFGLNLLQLITVHAGFIALVIGRQYRVTTRAESRRATLIRRRREAEKLARERQSLLQILTHEVRQPLNNALAALQEITRTIDPAKYATTGLAQPLERLHHTIDDVVLSLSNAIVGASLIERRAAQTLTSVDLSAIAVLACGDCAMEEQSRIHLSGADRSLFVQGDPVLLRLAFRNLLDNAIKFSPPGGDVQAQIRIDEDRLGIVFAVCNFPAVPFRPDPALFERAARGETPVEGRGLGLFIVREVARVHSGEATVDTAEDGQVRFELLIPG